MSLEAPHHILNRSRSYKSPLYLDTNTTQSTEKLVPLKTNLQQWNRPNGCTSPPLILWTEHSGILYVSQRLWWYWVLTVYSSDLDSRPLCCFLASLSDAPQFLALVSWDLLSEKLSVTSPCVRLCWYRNRIK